MFGKKGFEKRVGQAVDRVLEPGEQVVSSVWTRAPGHDVATALGGVFDASTPSFIVTLTDRRVIVHQGNNTWAAKSELLGSYPRAQVISLDPPSDKPKRLALRFGTEKDAAFRVQPAWQKQAKAFLDDLATDRPTPSA